MNYFNFKLILFNLLPSFMLLMYRIMRLCLYDFLHDYLIILDIFIILVGIFVIPLYLAYINSIALKRTLKSYITGYIIAIIAMTIYECVQMLFSLKVYEYYSDNKTQPLESLGVSIEFIILTISWIIACVIKYKIRRE